MNRVQLTGYLDQDIEIGTLRQGREMATLVLAMTKSWQACPYEGAELISWQKQMEVYLITVFKPSVIVWLKEEIKRGHFQKGDPIFVQGSLSYVGGSGNRRKTPQIVVAGPWGQVFQLHVNDNYQSFAKGGIKQPIPLTLEKTDED